MTALDEVRVSREPTPTFMTVVREQKFTPVETLRPKWSIREAEERLELFQEIDGKHKDEVASQEEEGDSASE